MYSTDAEYRAFLRNLMGMDPTRFYETEDIHVDPTDPKVSEETIDEYNYDVDAVRKYLDRVYEDTHSRPEFKRLYELAAGLMFSTDHQIGLAVLMSYDYLAWFYSCYANFKRDPAGFNETEEYYAKLVARLSTK